MIWHLIATLITLWRLDAAVAAAIAAAVLALFYRLLLSRKAAARNRTRTLRWRIRVKVRPGAGYASLAELLIRWSRMAAFFHGRRARPGLTWTDRLTCPTTEYAVRLGRAQYFRRLFSRLEDQVLVLAPQRVGKSGVIADRIVDHPGAVLATSTKADLFGTTGADRARLGLVDVFNPQGVGDVASTLRWDMIGPCRDLVMARRMAAWLSGGAQGTGHGNIEWFEQKGEVALAGLLLAASVTGATIADVFRWVQLEGHQSALKALAEHGTPEMLAVVRRMLDGNRTSGSVRDTIELSLAWAAIPQLAEAVTPGPDDAVFDVARFVLGRGTLYMIASGGEDSPVTPLFRALASYIHYQAGLIGTLNPAGRLDPPLLMALDEVAVICPVNLPEMLADAAGKGILIMPVVHGVSQLEGRWGKDGAATIWATCGTKMLLPGISDADTLENVSKLCGSVTTGTPPNDRAVRVVPPELLRTLPDWHALVVRMNLSPVVVRVRPVWKRPERRFPLRYLRARPTFPAFPDLPLPLPETIGFGELPEIEPSSPEFPDLVPASQPRGAAWARSGDEPDA
jgi:type IV secretion system protein VirD4